MAGIMQNRGQGVLTLTRIIIEASAMMFITAAILDYGVGMSRVGRWLSELQIVPAALALSISTLILWFAVTLIFGRIYCSTICPLGALIDLFARLRGQRREYHYSRQGNWIRSLSLGICLIVISTNALPHQWIEPFGLYSEIITNLTHPRIYLATAVSIVVIALISVMAWRHGRRLCTTICPVGTILGYVSQQSALRFDINTDRCTQCRRCEHVCKSECIDLNTHVIDMSRCVVCFNCLPVCPDDAITYTTGRHTLSWPMMQRIKSPTPSNAICNNTLTCSTTSSQTGQSNQTAQAQAQSVCSADNSDSTLPTDSRC